MVNWRPWPRFDLQPVPGTPERRAAFADDQRRLENDIAGIRAGAAIDPVEQQTQRLVGHVDHGSGAVGDIGALGGPAAGPRRRLSFY